MSGKRIPMGLKPGAPRNADQWVGSDAPKPEREEGAGAEVPIKRLTVDIPEPLHRRLKVKAAQDGVRMVDLVRGWIEDGCSNSSG